MRNAFGVIFIVFMAGAAFFVKSSFNSNSIDSDNSVEHSIVLNLNSRHDQKLFQALNFTNYECKTIYINVMECSLKQSEALQTSMTNSLLEKTAPILSYVSKTGKNYKVFKLRDGSTHLEVESEDQSKIVYSFTSRRNLLKFSRLSQKTLFLEEFPKPSRLAPSLF